MARVEPHAEAEHPPAADDTVDGGSPAQTVLLLGALTVLMGGHLAFNKRRSPRAKGK